MKSPTNNCETYSRVNITQVRNESKQFCSFTMEYEKGLEIAWNTLNLNYTQDNNGD